jgi:NADP-dependent 3-hydroxy acid dehydrogenase YdfG
MASRIYAVIAGAGPGTGAAVAHKFAAKYPVVLLARRADSYATLVSGIKANGGKALGIPTDVSSAESVNEAFNRIDKEFGSDASCVVRISRSFGKF